MIVKGFTAKLYPTRVQADRLNQWAGSLRFLWNRPLERERASYDANKTFLWKRDLQPIAVGMKREPGLEWLGDLPAHAVLDTVARLDGALRKMVKDRKAGRRYGFRKPKKKFVNEAGVYCVGQATRFEDDGRCVRLPKFGRVRMRGGVKPEGRLLAARVWRDGQNWMLSAQFECARPAPLEPTGRAVGIDLGLKVLATVCDGETFEAERSPKPLDRALKRLRRLQRVQSRRRKGSARRRVAARKVANLHRKVRHQRKDVLHQLSHRLTAKADHLTIETLNIRGMMRGLRLGRSVADAGMGELVRQIGYKADWRDREVYAVDRWRPSTKPCSSCGTLHEMPLGKATMRCGCGLVMDRDENAALNLFRYGEEHRNRAGDGPTRGDRGDQAAAFGLPPVPLVEPRMLAAASP